MKKINITKENTKNFILAYATKLQKDRVTSIGAELAYYIVLSIFPFMIFLLNILSFTPFVATDTVGPFINILPIDLQNLILSLIHETIRSSSETLLSISALTGLWAASKATTSFITLMNNAFEVKETRSYLYRRFLAIVFTIGLLLAFILSLIALVFGRFLASKVFSFIGLGSTFINIWNYLRTILTLVFMVIIFALLYKFAPSQKGSLQIGFIESLPGAIFASIGWVISSLAFSYFVNNFGNYSKTYGSLAAIVLLLIWLYMSSVIIMMGGELNATIKSIKLNK